MSHPVPLVVRVAGDYACFTRPELKAERVSYPTMTPSAARGILEAIFWKPEMQWRVESIETLRPVRWFTIRRNELSAMPALRSVTAWPDRNGGYDAETDRDQRNTLALRDVAYLIRAQIELTPNATEDVAKYRDMFRRRVSKGQCFSQPFLGCREFAASFGEVQPAEQPIDWHDHLGLMFWGFDYSQSPPKSQWFSARVDQGVLTVPSSPIDAEPGGAA